MRTTKSTVTFGASFILDITIGELPSGVYDVEIDEEEISGIETIAYRRVATWLIVKELGSTRSIAVDSAMLDFALRRDAEQLSSVHSRSR
jgi:hypothetical protein